MRWLALLLLFGTALSASPRVGLHEGFTRLVLDLPQGASYRVVEEAGRVVVKLEGASLEAISVSVNSPELKSYRAEGNRLFIYPNGPVKVKAFVLEGKAPGTYRLVIDLVRGPPEAKKPSPPKPVVVIDPGHGGPDPGAVHTFRDLGRIEEEDIALDIALRVKKILEARGIEVVLTRDRDTDLAPPEVKDLYKRKLIDLDRRAKMADSKKTLFVSIHVNSAPRPAMGVETYILGRAIDPEAQRLAVWENGGGEVGERLTRETETLADQLFKDLLVKANQTFSKRLASEIQTWLARAAASPDRGVRRAPLYVLRYARIPAVLVEVGFINHPTEGRNLANPSHRQRLAEGIAQGILNFLSGGAYAFR